MQPATLQSLSNLGVEAIELWCHSCGHHGEVEIAVLVPRLGADYPVPDVWRHAKCQACGERTKLESRPAWGRISPGVITRHT